MRQSLGKIIKNQKIFLWKKGKLLMVKIKNDFFNE